MKTPNFISTARNRLNRASLRLRAITPYHLIPLYAAHACYFMMLAVFPLLMLIISMIRYTPFSLDTLLELMDGVVPTILQPAIEQLVINTYDHSSTAIVSVSAIAALWSASRSIYGLIIGLNAIYQVRENRGYFYTRLISVVYMFLFLVVLVLTLILHVFGQAILNLISQGPVFGFFNDILNFRFLLLLLVQTALFTAVYSALPNRRNAPGTCLPGAVFASVGWQVASYGFSLYMEHFPLYASIYGSVYAVAMSMLWLYCCVFIIFLGGALNRVLAYWISRDEQES